jgi:hypothetical protein
MDESFVGLAERPGKQHEQVEIRMQAELPASVPAEREDADELRGRTGICKELLDEGVHALRVLLERMASPGASSRRSGELTTGAIESGAPDHSGVRARINRSRRSLAHWS